MLPPSFPASNASADAISLERGMDAFVDEVKGIRRYADVILIAKVKDLSRIWLDTVQVALDLSNRLRVLTAPVIVLRDMNRPQFESSLLACFSGRLDSVMVAWGDSYPDTSTASNVRDFQSLADAVRRAALLRDRVRARTRFFAPVDLDNLASTSGQALAHGRVQAGADLLLAQPPTTDARTDFEKHTTLIRRTGLSDQILPCVFPFRGSKDILRYERKFGWKVPGALRRVAAKGERRLLETEKEVVERLRDDGFPGVYLVTRGNPNVARLLLG